MTILQVRFGEVSPEITHLVNQVGGAETLRELQRQAMVLDSLPLFEKRLAEMVQEPA